MIFFKCHHYSVQQISRATSELEEILNQQETLDNKRMDDLLNTFPTLKQEPLRRLLEILYTDAEDSSQAALLQTRNHVKDWQFYDTINRVGS